MTKRKTYLCWVGLFLISCSTHVYTTKGSTSLQVVNTSTNRQIDSIVSPFRDSMKSKMGEVIGFSEMDVSRAKPNGLLNNWTADALHESFMNELAGKDFFTLLNYGGLRAPINKGEILLEDIFELMPFDNEVVLVKLRRTELVNIGEYLSSRKGEPIAGAILKGKELLLDDGSSDSNFFWVITSDYLANGGDNMTFFENKVQEIKTGVLLRDVFINAVKAQGNIQVKDDQRLILEE